MTLPNQLRAYQNGEFRELTDEYLDQICGEKVSDEELEERSEEEE